MNGKMLRRMGRGTKGVRGLRVSENDYLIGLIKVKSNQKIFVITENGYGKLMKFSLFHTKGRGGKGMAYIKVTNKNGKVVGIKNTEEEDELILSTIKGMVIRIIAGDISTLGRTAAGLRIVKVSSGDMVSDLTVVHKAYLGV